jgi:hypothetical protein
VVTQRSKAAELLEQCWYSSKKRLLFQFSKLQKAKTRAKLNALFFISVLISRLRAQRSHASCRLKVKQPSPDLAKVKLILILVVSARACYQDKTHYHCSQKQRREPQTIPRRPTNLEDDRPLRLTGLRASLSSNSIRADGSTTGAGSRSSASAGSASRSRASSESRSRETSEHAAAPPYPSPASLSRSI